MAQAAGVSWNDLSRSAKDALAWARAAEVQAADVGTRGLLIGMLRSGEDPPNALLRHFRVRENEVFDALQRQVRQRLNPIAPERPHLVDLPPLTDNARRCIERAAELRHEAEVSDIDVACLFTALLHTRGATARKALATVIRRVPIEEIGNATLDWLHSEKLTYPQVLEQRFPRSNPLHTHPLETSWFEIRVNDTTIGGAWLVAPTLAVASPLAPAQPMTEVVSADPSALPDSGLELWAPERQVAVRGVERSSQVRYEWLVMLRLAAPVAGSSALAAGSPAAGASYELFLAGPDPRPLGRGELGSRSSAGTYILRDLDAETLGALVWDPVAERVLGFVALGPEGFVLETLESLPLLEVTPAERSGAPPPTARVHADRWTVDDCLDYALYARAIAEFIRHPDTRPPLVISVQGPWGQGKTSMMRMVQQRLDRQHPDLESGARRVADAADGPSALTFRNLRDSLDGDVALSPLVEPAALRSVWFNAWKYQSSEALWAGLAHAILQQLPARLSRKDRELFWLRLQLRRIDPMAVRRDIHRVAFERFLPRLVVSLALGFVALLAVVAGGAVETAVGLGGAAVAVCYAGFQWLRSQRKALNRALEGSYLRFVRQPDYAEKMGYLHLVEEDMHQALELLTPPGEPTVIFIDDLDRCAPDKIGEVLEAINLFLSGEYPSCVFVLGIDSEVVAAAMEVVHKDVIERLGDRRGELGWRFMDKFVQLPFVMPRLSDRQRRAYLTSLLESPPEEGSAAEAMESANAIRAELNNGSLAPPEAAKRVGEIAPELAAANPQAWRELAEEAIAAGAHGFSDHDPEIVEALRSQMVYLSDNPRTIKRAVNLYRFHRFTAWARDASALGLEGADPDLIARWSVVLVRWPHFVRWLQTHADDGEGPADGVDAAFPDEQDLRDFLATGADGELDLSRAAACGLW